MSMEHNEPQIGQGQQAPSAVAVSISPEGAPVSSPGNPGQQRRRRRRRKTGKSASASNSSIPAINSEGGGLPAATPQVDTAADQDRSAQRDQAREPGRDAVRDQGRDQRQASSPDGSGDQQVRQARTHKQSGQQNHHKKQQRQVNGASSGSSQGRQFQKASHAQQPREYNPGNAIAQAVGQPGNGGPRRKNKVRRQAPTFVGPMDHSYRAVNGNVADGSPSTMDYRSSGNGNIHGRNGYADIVEAPPPVIIRDDAPSRILCFIEDLFVVAKMQETARKLGVKVSFAKAEKDTVTRLTDTPEAQRPSLIVFDLNNANAKPLTLIPKLKAKLKRGTSVIGFLSHIQGDLKVKAIEAGCDMVMPKSAFSQNLPNLLRRHGLDEDVDAVEV